LTPALARTLVAGTAFTLSVALTHSVTAAGHRDWSLVPLGSFRLAAGTQDFVLMRPADERGVIPAPVVLVAFFDAGSTSQPPVITLTVGSLRSRSWMVRRPGQMFLIGLDPLEQAAGRGGARVPLRIELGDEVPGLVLMASGAPDLALAGPGAFGPLEQVVERMPHGLEREYVRAALKSAGDDLAGARRDFERLARGADARVAKFARAALRRIRLAEVEAQLPASSAAHYRLGLYAQQCGLVRSARLHLEAALALQPRQPEAWFRLGEVMERCGDPLDDFMEAFGRSALLVDLPHSAWDVLLAVVHAEEVEHVEGGRTFRRRATLTEEGLAAVRRRWRQFELLIAAATQGRIRLVTRTIQIQDPREAGFRPLDCPVPAPGYPDPSGLSSVLVPPEEVVPRRGQVDWIVTLRPAGPDCGVRGAALSDLPVEADWQTLLTAFCRVLDAVGRAAELDELYPVLRHAAGCGAGPRPSSGYSLRAGLRYVVPPETFRRVEPATPDVEEGHILNWYVEPPRERSYVRPPHRAPPHDLHLMGPARLGPGARFVVFTSPFGDLEALLRGGAGAAGEGYLTVRATSYVLSPRCQEVRLWLGQNDGLALWVNDRLIHRGDQFPDNQLADRNLTATLLKPAILQQGWNRLDVAVERWPAPDDRGFGFSLRICDRDDRPLPGLVVASARTQPPRVVTFDPFQPRAGEFFKWAEVREDFLRALPRLDADGLRACGELPDGLVLLWRGGTGGFFAIGSPYDAELAESSGVPLRPLPGVVEKADSAGGAEVPPAVGQRSGGGGIDSMARLDNVLDWEREAAALYPIRRGGHWRHLLLLKPEAVTAFLECLVEAPAAERVFGGAAPAERIRGWIRAGEGEDWQPLIVIETLLPGPLPEDEEDLLSPG